MNIKNKKYQLAIETTGRIAGVALLDKSKIISECNLNTGLTHSVTLFNNINNILIKNKINMSNINKISVSNGPGSFTGVRIGVAAALGLAKAYNTKIEYIDTLDALAYKSKNKADYIISMIDAKANRVYLSIYNGRDLNKIQQDIIVNIESLCKMLNYYFSKKNVVFLFTGDGTLQYYNEFLKPILKIKYIISDNPLHSASSVGLVKGIVSKTPLINYMLASKAERDRYGNC